MKKIVVVVRSEKILFESADDNLKAIDTDRGWRGRVGEDTRNKILLVSEGKNIIAVFRDWDYWRELKD